MSADLIVSVDAGTSVIKAVAFDLQGRQIGVTSTPNRVQLGEGGAAEQDMDATWTAMVSTVLALAKCIPNLTSRVAAFTATGQGDGTWLIDSEGQPVGPALLWLDGRSAPQINQLRASPAAKRLAEITGTALNPSMQSGQLLWLRENHPERLARANAVMHCKDWLYFKATGERVTCHAEGLFTFGDYRTHCYAEEALTLLGLFELRHLLPPMLEGSTRPGKLGASAAAEMGLPAGLPVVFPPMDVPATLLGSGAFAYEGKRLRRVGCSILGSTGMHGWVTDQLKDVIPSSEAGYTMSMPVKGVNARLMSHMAATLNIDWLLGLVTEAQVLGGAAPVNKSELLLRLNSMVLAARPAQALFHPYIADNGERGPFVDPSARAQLSGFNTTLGLAAIARSVMEGIAFAARDCYSALGPMPSEIRLSGGAARSPALRALLASVCAAPVRTSNREECGAAGAALVAAVAIGCYAQVVDALPDWVDHYLDSETTIPDTQHSALYEQLFPIYQGLASSSRPHWAAMQQLRRPLTPARAMNP